MEAIENTKLVSEKILNDYKEHFRNQETTFRVHKKEAKVHI